MFSSSNKIVFEVVHLQPDARVRTFIKPGVTCKSIEIVKLKFLTKSLSLNESDMASLGKANQQFKDLKTEFSKPKADLEKCGKLLRDLKVNKQKKICFD